MSTHIDITAMEPGQYGVQITEGSMTTSHRVAVSSNVVDTVSPGATPGDQALETTLVRESIQFLLEREPATEILDSFSLDDIPRYFPQYSEEIITRMSS